MKTTIVSGIVFGMLVGMLFFNQPTDAMVERKWLIPDVDYPTGPSGYINAYMRVSQEDKVTINWKSGPQLSSTEELNITIFTTVMTVSYDGWDVESSDLSTANPRNFGYNWRYNTLYTCGTSPSKSMWIEVGSFDVLCIEIGGTESKGLSATQTFNVTLTPSDLPFTKDLTDNVTRIEQTLVNLTNDLTSGLDDLNVTINELQTYIDMINQSLWEGLSYINVNLLHALLLFNQSLQDNLTSIRCELLSLLNFTLAVNISLNKQIADIPKYNDSVLWDEVNELRKVQPVVNNITEVNQTIINQTIVNQTNQTEVRPMTYLADPNESIMTGASVGVVAGVISGAVSSIVIGRKKSKNELQQEIEEGGEEQ